MALAEAIASSHVSAIEAMEAAIAAAQTHSGFGAVDVLVPELGLCVAEVMEQERLDRPARFVTRPFAGVPTLAKNLGSPFAGIPASAGSNALRGIADGTADSEFARRFRKMGLIPFGSTLVPEFGLSLASEPIGLPPARNPLDPERTPGGSSGGAAAAVAAGIVAIAHATDAGGSIRVPAACCGLIGLKPTRGLMPGGPDFGNHLGGLASEFAVCRSVRDARRAFDHLAGHAKGPTPEPVLDPDIQSRLTIGLIGDLGPFALDPARERAVREAAALLEGAGHRIADIPFARLQTLVASGMRGFDRIICASMAAAFANGELDEDKLEPLTRAVLERGRALPAAELWSAEQEAVLAAHAMWRLFGEVDLLLTPMLSAAPPKLGAFPTDHDAVEAHWGRMTAFAPLASLANMTGVPALALPFGEDADGLPLPVQIMGPMGADRRLLTLAETLERLRPWAHRFPVAGLPA
ncbi:amidase [Breoghania corrubedonensis]|uniref:Indoleacetamide hydrolase n=2 Tax=Breoghania corrubedonensis TaxID=665038 RepID=A0A2T5VFU9_9HYPH|nr:amidase [Breoghania corrubedonensis]